MAGYFRKIMLTEDEIKQWHASKLLLKSASKKRRTMGHNLLEHILDSHETELKDLPDGTILRFKGNYIQPVLSSK